MKKFFNTLLKRGPVAAVASAFGHDAHAATPLPTMTTEDTPIPTPATEAAAAPAPAEAPAAPVEPSLAEQLAELQAKHVEVSDAYLRAKAETENIRRRSEEELAKARKFAVEAFAESLLPVKDSLEAAIANPNAPVDKVLEGVQATLRQLASALERNKVVEVAPPAGTKFDPHQHQAISMVPAEQDPNTVVMVLQKGYLIAERVLRPALVTVAAPK
ncbi:co-chaperone GrpE [Vitreoscilla filiformis]|uniref:Protein GrpE n=1 Tax=Vitreoscilla filiformis TaxID=63 RepID=A0A221KFP9_VITFI|nr:co-chaperone GrpE [Vitreoscilla filiformis]